MELSAADLSKQRRMKTKLRHGSTTASMFKILSLSNNLFWILIFKKKWILLLALSPSAYAGYKFKNTIFSQLTASQKSFEIYRLRAKDLYTCSFYAPRRHSIHTQPYEPSHTDARMLASQSIPQSTAIQPRICPLLTGHALLTESSAVRKRLWFLSTPTDAHIHEYINNASQLSITDLCRPGVPTAVQVTDYSGMTFSLSITRHCHLSPFQWLTLKNKGGWGSAGRIVGTGQESMIKPAS